MSVIPLPWVGGRVVNVCYSPPVGGRSVQQLPLTLRCQGTVREAHSGNIPRVRASCYPKVLKGVMVDRQCVRRSFRVYRENWSTIG